MWQAVVPFPKSHGPIDLISHKELFKALPPLKSVRHGVVCLFVRGSGAALSVNENCDSTVRSDMTEALLRILPPPAGGATSSAARCEAADARALLMTSSLCLPVSDGAVNFGTWQGIYFARLRPDAIGDLVLTVMEACAKATQPAASFTFNADQRKSHVIDAEVERAIAKKQKCDDSSGSSQIGTLLVHEKHTSASLSLAGRDLEPAMRAIVPEQWNEEFFQHTFEGPDDMPGHVKSTLLGCGVTVPIAMVSGNGKPGQLMLGEGQAVLLNEHRDVGGWGTGHSRKVQVTQLSGGIRCTVTLAPCAEALADLTDDVRRVVADVLAGAGGSPGIAHVFAPSACSAVFAAEASAAQALVVGLEALTADAGARAAIAKNGLAVPFDDTGHLLIAESQKIWLYNAECPCGPIAATGQEQCQPSSVIVTVHRTLANGPAPKI